MSTGGTSRVFIRATSALVEMPLLRVMDAASGNFVSSMGGSPKADSGHSRARSPFSDGERLMWPARFVILVAICRASAPEKAAIEIGPSGC